MPEGKYDMHEHLIAINDICHRNSYTFTIKREINTDETTFLINITDTAGRGQLVLAIRSMNIVILLKTARETLESLHEYQTEGNFRAGEFNYIEKD